jgi:hypothetical protein
MRHGLFPDFSSHRVIRQPLRVLDETARIVALHDYNESRMELATAILEDAAIGDFVGEGVLKGVLEVGEEARLVEEFGGLKVGQMAAQRIFRSSATA